MISAWEITAVGWEGEGRETREIKICQSYILIWREDINIYEL